MKLKSKSLALVTIAGLFFLVLNFRELLSISKKIEYPPEFVINSTLIPIQTQAEKIKYIFSLTKWREILVMKQSKGNMSMCDIPESVRSIANMFCNTTLRKPCLQLPCSVVYRSEDTDERNVYSSTGRIDTNKQIAQSNKSIVEQIECVTSPALELFMHGTVYPSLITNGYDRITKELHGDVLSKYFRSLESVWGLFFNWESTIYYPWCANKSILSLFDITLGPDRQSHDVIADAYLLNDMNSLMLDKRVSSEAAIETKRNPPSYVNASIVWLASNCDTYSNRSAYMRELMKYIQVDSWGKCERNRGPQLPPEIIKIHNSNSTENHFLGDWQASKKAMTQHYKFTVAIENSIAHDYVTEKLWQPLAAGSVPLYYGAPNIDDWLPCQNCIIDLRKFRDPKAVAEYVDMLSKNETLYAEYHKWRREPLLPSFEKILDYFKRANTYTLDSMVCAMAHSKHPSLKRYEILNDIGPVF